MAVSPRLGSRLYAIADAECLGADPQRFAHSVAAIVRGGVGILQLRLKPADPDLARDDTLRFEMIERSLEALETRGLRDGVQLVKEQHTWRGGTGLVKRLSDICF